MPATSTPPRPARTPALAPRIALGLGTVALSVVGFGAWSLNAELSGAVIASGQMIADGRSKRVQSALAGTVVDLKVRDGDRVAAGDVLIRLEDTEQRALVAILKAQSVEAEAQIARLRAERDGLERIDFPARLDASLPSVATVLAEERRLFELKLGYHRVVKQRLAERLAQFRREAEALAIQADAKRKETGLARTEGDVVRDLARRQLTTLSRATQSERDLARLEGERGALLAQKARIEGQIGEIELQLSALDQNRFTDAQKELRPLEARIEELSERRATAEQRLAQAEIRSPVSGLVNELAIAGPGAVLRASETVMTLVPDQDELVAELKVRPEDVDQVTIGQPSRIRLRAFNQRTTPEVLGRVARLSAEAIRDDRSGTSHYLAAVRIPAVEVARLGTLALVAGMPVEGLIVTGERTLASFLLRPLTDQMNRAFRED